MATLRRLRREVPEPGDRRRLADRDRRPACAAPSTPAPTRSSSSRCSSRPWRSRVSAVGCGQSVVPRTMRASVERPAFSHRERQVLTYVSQGLTNAQIAERAVPLGEHDQEPPLVRFREVRRALAPRGGGALPRARTATTAACRAEPELIASTPSEATREHRNRANALPLAATEGTRVPFIRLDSADPELFAELMEAVERVARDSAFTLGPELERFERAFAAFCGTEHAVGVSSGTAALELALRGTRDRPRRRGDRPHLQLHRHRRGGQHRRRHAGHRRRRPGDGADHRRDRRARR